MEPVAVLLPIYAKDNADYIKLSINSILNQSYHNVKLLIGVDGPVDQVIQHLLTSFTEDVRVNVHYFPINRGLACVLNDLITAGRKEGYSFFARMDADDISLDKRIEFQMDYLKNHEDVDVVGGAIAEIDENSQPNGKIVTYPENHSDCRRMFRYRDPLAHPATLFRSRYFDKAKGYRNEYRKNQDTMLWYDGFMNGCIFANVQDTVLYFRVTNDFYKARRSGFSRAKKMLKDRWMINKHLKFGLSSYLFASAMFVVTISPAWLRKLLYRIR